MRKLLIFFAAVGLMAGFATKVNAQNAITGIYDDHTLNIDIPEVALINIWGSGSNATTLVPTTTVAGTKIEDADGMSNPLYLEVSSIITTAPAVVDPPADAYPDTRKIQVKLSALVPGFDIKVASSTPAGGGVVQGTFGTPIVVPFTLTTSDQSLVSGIGSCWTDIHDKGYPILYTLAVNDYRAIRAKTSAYAITVTYTIVDDL